MSVSFGDLMDGPQPELVTKPGEIEAGPRIFYGGYRVPDSIDPDTDDFGELITICEGIWMHAPHGKAYRALAGFILDRETFRDMDRSKAK